MLCATGRAFVASVRLVVLGAPSRAAMHGIVLQLMHVLCGSTKTPLLCTTCRVLLAVASRMVPCFGQRLNGLKEIWGSVRLVPYFGDRMQAWRVCERSLRQQDVRSVTLVQHVGRSELQGWRRGVACILRSVGHRSA